MSAKKEKVEFIRTDEFEAVEDELGLAMERLEDANARISELLNSENRDTSNVVVLELPAEEISAGEAMPEATSSVPRIRRGKSKSDSVLA